MLLQKAWLIIKFIMNPTIFYTPKIIVMPKYIIEREIPGAGHLNDKQLEAILQISNDVLLEIGPEIQWDHSYLTDNKLYCIYSAPSKELISEHARKVGIPANNISEVIEVIDASTHPSSQVHEAWYY